MEINKEFESIYVINLKKDIERKNIFLDNNGHLKINFRFIEGVNGYQDETCKKIFETRKGNFKSLGQIGYLQSMLKIFNDAKKNEYKKIIIFDDDAILCENFNDNFTKYYKQVPEDWNIIRIGTTNHRFQQPNIDNNKNFYVSTRTDGSFAVCYKMEIFDQLINEIQKYNTTFDSGALNTVTKGNYTLYPFLAIADVYVSGILKNRDLYTLAQKVGWNLSLFKIRNSLRKVIVIVKNPKKFPQQSYKNYEVLEKVKDNSRFVIKLDDENVDKYFIERVINEYIRTNKSIYFK